MKKVARLLPIVIMVLLVAALSASPVLANPGHDGGHGKGGGNDGGNGGGKGKGNGGNDTTSTATLKVSPDSPLAYDIMTISGDDFWTKPSRDHLLQAHAHQAQG